MAREPRTVGVVGPVLEAVPERLQRTEPSSRRDALPSRHSRRAPASLLQQSVVAGLPRRTTGRDPRDGRR